MTKNEAFPSKYLKAEDIPTPQTLVIEDVRMETLQNGGERKCIMSFKDRKKTLVLNLINFAAAEKLYGEDTASWTGNSIVLYATTCEFKGDTVPCLRLRAPARRPAAAPKAAPVAQAAPAAPRRASTLVQPIASAVAFDLDQVPETAPEAVPEAPPEYETEAAPYSAEIPF